MALPSSPNAISMNQVNVELSYGGTAQVSLNDSAVRTLFQVASGQISLSDGWGKSAVPPEVAPSIIYNNGYNASVCEWDAWGPSIYVSGTFPMNYELLMYSNGCGGGLMIDSGNTGGSGYTSGTWIYPGSNYSAYNNGTYMGGGTPYKAAHYKVYLYNGGGSVLSNAFYVEYGWCDFSCSCPWYCGTTQVCNACDYDCSGDCATGYAAVCECDPGASDWCQPNCPCEPYSCGYSYECNCSEECNYQYQYTTYAPDGSCS